MSRPALADLLASMRVVQLPLTTFFRGINQREVVLFEGPSGWGEFAPFRDHTVEHSAMWLRAAIEAAYESWPEARRNKIPVNGIVPALKAESIATWAGDAHSRFGITTFKIKCGSANFADDVIRVQALCAALTNEADLRVRIDVNGSWSANQAIERIQELDDASRHRIEYVEQPVASLKDAALVRSHVKVKIALDESIRLQGGTAAEIREAADIAILKAIPLGGVNRALEVATELDMPCVVSGSLDTSVGLSQGIALAAALPQLASACGLATAQLFARDVTETSIAPENGSVNVGRVAPSAQLLDELEADTETQDFWRNRITACYEALGAS